MKKYIIIDPFGFPGKPENNGMCTTSMFGETIEPEEWEKDIIAVSKRYCKERKVNNEELYILWHHGNIALVNSKPGTEQVCLYVVEQEVYIPQEAVSHKEKELTNIESRIKKLEDNICKLRKELLIWTR